MTHTTKPAPIEVDNVLPFRPARGQRIPYRRRHPIRRLVRPFLAAVLIVAAPLWIASWLLTTEQLAFGELAVVHDPGLAPAWVERMGASSGSGIRHVDERWVNQALAPLRGRNLMRLSIADAEELIAGHPWVRSVGVRKELPHRLRVAIVEYRPVALLETAEAFHYVDADGRRIAKMAPEDAAMDLLLISRPGRAEGVDGTRVGDADERADLQVALQVVAEIDQVQQVWSEGLSEVEILGEQDVRLVTRALPFPLLVRAGTLGGRLRRLEALLPQIEARYGAVEAVDLRFTRRIIIQPSGAERVRAEGRKA